ncbi:uncharacterized protein LOC117513470 [Thalassophryne amazonica]|uniref:uncharacterized protein LOC117513470 n=1 Tax=Thalassophryne amazonica TaxID=390379 RepID=UPI0014714D65|nr:uncharacterized protein LOC117513470 [Thalassophryne amazonica]
MMFFICERVDRITMLRSLFFLLLSHSSYAILSGWVESPGYPRGYPPHSNLSWNRCAPKGHIISLKLIHLDLEDSQNCENDVLKIFSNGSLISILCGKTDYEALQSSVNPLLLSSSGGCLSLSFHSDYSNTKKHTGFKGFFTVRDFDECEDDPDNGCTQFCHNVIGGYHCSCRHGYQLDTDKHTCTVSCNEDLSGKHRGQISSPFWPAPYADSSRCLYTLSVEDHLQLELHFLQDFDVEQDSDGQCIDSLKIETLSGTLGPFCGQTPPKSPFLTYSHHVQIHFSSDASGSNKGFALHYKTRDKVCLGVVSPNSIVAPEKQEYRHGETVTVTCNVGYVAYNKGILAMMSEYETTCQRTGLWNPSYICEAVDCGFPDVPEDGILQLVDSEVQSTLYRDEIQFKCSSKYYTLEGDDTYTCNSSGKWVSVRKKEEMPRCIEVCGKTEEDIVNTGRIMGGRDAELGQIPWQLLIKVPSRGGASLISDRWAVTAAHVVDGVEDSSLRLYGGLVDGRLASDVVALQSEKIIIHPGFQTGVPNRLDFDNDIALIRLSSRVQFGPNLLPICLPLVNRGLAENEQGTVSGWGVTDTGHVSPTLKYAHITVYSISECKKTPLSPNNNPLRFTRNMFCAGAPQIDSCKKDSGGPVVMPMLGSGNKNNIGPYCLIGIVSWGPPCRQKKYKGYYTRVSSYVNWIQSTMDTAGKETFGLLKWIHSYRNLFNVKMKWSFCIIWFLLASMCECWRLPDPEPVMYGEVHSPQYPQPYPANVLKQWDLTVPDGYQIQLTFTHLDIEASADCYYDAVTIQYNKKVLGKFCGQENSADGHHPGNQPILSPGNKLTLIFQSDDTNPELHQNIGFSAQYQAKDIDECAWSEPEDASRPHCSQICFNMLGSYVCSCHHGYELLADQHTCALSCIDGTFDEPEGHLSSPGYPNPPSQAVSCQYVISVQPGFIISLNFTDNFHIESVDTELGPNCLYHWLELTISDREPVKLCGSTSPGLIVTNSSTVTLKYHNDEGGLSHGWSLDYTTHRVKCPSPGDVDRGRVTPLLSEFYYRDYIFVRCDQGYKLMMNGEEMSSFSAMCQSNGQWHLPLPECHIIDCGEPQPLLNGGVTFISGVENQYQSVIQYHCNEPFYHLPGGVNVSYTCEADRKWRYIHDAAVIPICVPVCGEPTNDLPAFQRILGGSSAPEGTIPWQVLLNAFNRGGGMVIADRWILTAAHVLQQKGERSPIETIKVYVGLTDVAVLRVPPLPVASIHIHPNYHNPNDLDYNNDIALIKLQHPLTFNSTVMPVCLPAAGASYVTGLMGLVSGFGVTNEDGQQMLSNKMKYVRVPVVDQQICSDSVSAVKQRSPNIPGLTGNMFCAGMADGKKDSCQGDSGSPFAISENGRYWAAGIVSWGIGCAQSGRYGVYTRVVNYLNWIDKTMNEN